MDLEKSIRIVEEERCKELNQHPLSVDSIIEMGSVKYVTGYLTDDIRRKAHQLLIKNETDGFDATVQESLKLVWLVFFKMENYIKDVDLHIKYIKLLGEIIFPLDGELQERFQNHDCSKYSYEEAYGYVLRWTHGVEHCNEWEQSLKHHFENNDHHPEFFKGKSMSRAGLMESIVDMLSWRLIKNRSANTGLPVSDWLFDVEDKFLLRYTEEDRKTVRDTLNGWKQKQFDVNHL